MKGNLTWAVVTGDQTSVSSSVSDGVRVLFVINQRTCLTHGFLIGALVYPRFF